MVFVRQRDKFSGCLIGQCLGDALGFRVEGSPPDICAPYVEQLRTRGTELPLNAHHDFPFGQYTDDSQLARELMVSYAALGRFDPADYDARIRSIFAENRIVGRGMATDAAARRLKAGGSLSYPEGHIPLHRNEFCTAEIACLASAVVFVDKIQPGLRKHSDFKLTLRGAAL